MHKSECVQDNETHKVLWDFEILADHLISSRKPNLVEVIFKKKRTCQIVDFAVLVDHRMKTKENKNRGKYFDLARELKKLRKMKVTEVPIVICALGTIPKGLVRGFWKSNDKPRLWLRLAKILRRVQES